MPEQELVKSCKESLSNFTIIYDLYVKDVYRYVYSRLENKAESEDITSETFLKAIEKISTYEYKEGRSIKWWLFAIARNLMIDKYRKKDFISFDEEYTAWSDENVLDAAVSKDLISRVEEYIRAFKPPVPEIIQLKIWEEMTFDEIAELLGKSVASIKMAYYRALEKIHTEFIKEGANIYG